MPRQRPCSTARKRRCAHHRIRTSGRAVDTQRMRLYRLLLRYHWGELLDAHGMFSLLAGGQLAQITGLELHAARAALSGFLRAWQRYRRDARSRRLAREPCNRGGHRRLGRRIGTFSDLRRARRQRHKRRPAPGRPPDKLRRFRGAWVYIRLIAVTQNPNATPTTAENRMNNIGWSFFVCLTQRVSTSSTAASAHAFKIEKVGKRAARAERVEIKQGYLHDEYARQRRSSPWSRGADRRTRNPHRHYSRNAFQNARNYKYNDDGRGDYPQRRNYRAGNSARGEADVCRHIDAGSGRGVDSETAIISASWA